jgi:hypothetical protein
VFLFIKFEAGDCSSVAPEWPSWLHFFHLRHCDYEYVLCHEKEEDIQNQDVGLGKESTLRI